jgi:hypothetical protein
MDQSGLNTDIFYEIFPHFVAVDPEGPFTLMLVCTAWQDMVLKHPLLWSWIHMDADFGDLEARIAACTTLSASQPLYLNLYVPYPPSFIGFIRPHAHRVHSIVVHMPMNLEMYEAVSEVSKMIRDLHLEHVSFRFLSGGEDVFYSPTNMHKILEKHSLNQPFELPTCPSNMITALTLDKGLSSLHTFLTWLSLNSHLQEINIHRYKLHMVKESTLPIVLLPSLHALMIHNLHRVSTGSERVGSVFLRHIQSPNPISITLIGELYSLVAQICEIGAGLRPSALILDIEEEIPSPQNEELEKIKRVLSSIRNFRIYFHTPPTEMFQISQLLQCLPRSAVLHIGGLSNDNQLLHLVNHSPHLIQLDYRRHSNRVLETSPSLPAWCRNDQRFDSLSLGGYCVGEMASYCKKLFLLGSDTARTFHDFKFSLYIEELFCDATAHESNYVRVFHPKIRGLPNLSKLTCGPSFALSLVRQRYLPKLRELILIDINFNSDDVEALIYHLEDNKDTSPPIKLLSIPAWISWQSIFTMAELLSEINDDSPVPTLILTSFPHIRILRRLVDVLNGAPATYLPDFPPTRSMEWCRYSHICYQCHHGDWVCTGVDRCQRGRRGERAAITRYTISN